MLKLAFAIAISYAVVAGLSSTARGAETTTEEALNKCHSRDKLINFLDKKHGESLKGAGIATTGKLIEVYTNDQSGTFTIVITTPSKELGTSTSCMVTDGEGWRNMSAKILGPEA